MICRTSAVLTALLFVFSPVSAQPAYTPNLERQTAQDLKRLSLEELAEIDITSVSRRSERLADTAAAVSVILPIDLRRSGVTTLGDAMRLADAVDVAQQNPTVWAVTARGFDISTANKLLVLVDGRSVYSPLFSGTFWEIQDLVLEDIERIEVIRGPGGAAWGANAMNGVVNVITKDAADTRGNFALLTTGTDEHLIVSGRHGGRMPNGGNYRVYGKFRQRESTVLLPTGTDVGNDLLIGHGGFRLDSDADRATRWSIQGSAYRGTVALLNRGDGDLAGGIVLGRWTRRFSSASEFRAQIYYDRTWRKVPLQFEEIRDTVDVDTQHRLQLAGRHDLMFGGGLRVSRGDDRGVAGFFFEPEKRTHELFSFFAQDEVALRPARLFLRVGSKFERNDFTGFEAQPTVRLRWSRRDRQTVWGAVSRAVRLPTRFDTDLRIVNPVTRQVFISGTEDFDAESVVAYEGGYRVRPHERLALDVAAYLNRYDDLRSQELPSRAGEPVTLRNFLNATTSGVELAGTWQAAENWRVHASYAYLWKEFTFDPQSTDITGGASEANDPSSIFKLRSYLDLPAGLQLDAVFRAASARPNPEVPAYSEVDVRLGWVARAGWELSLVGQNLLHDRHPELFTQGSPRWAVRRGAYIRSAWRF
jgi:iron complex outermembrane receptor protein